MGDHEYEVVTDQRAGIARIRETSHSIARNRLGKWEKRILNYLSDVCFDNDVNRVAVSRGQLAKVFDGQIERRNVLTVLDSLERKGFIRKENQTTGNGFYMENVYTILKPAEMREATMER
jgi:hypothetical protein